jgi:hypothetical protein
LVNEADATAVEEFCDLYNQRISSFKKSEEAFQFRVETTHDIPLYTFGRADRHDVEAIKIFAESSFFAHEPFSWDNFAYVPVVTRNKALTAVSELGNCMDSSKRRVMSADDALRIGQEIETFETAISLEVSRLEWWSQDSLIKLVDNQLSTLREPIRNGLKEKLFLRLRSEDLVELKKNV